MAGSTCHESKSAEALHVCHAAAKVLSEPPTCLHRLQIFQTACRHGHFRLSVHNSSDSGTVEFGMHAFTVGAAVVSLLRWLSELRERLMKVRLHRAGPLGTAAVWWPSKPATEACHAVVGCMLLLGPAACPQAGIVALPPGMLALQECLGLLRRVGRLVAVFVFGGPLVIKLLLFPESSLLSLAAP